MAMAMSCMIGKSFPTVVSLPLRPISFPKSLFAVKSEISSNNHHHACTDAKKTNLLDHKLVAILKSEIKPHERFAVKKSMPPVPAGFPFAIEDVGYRTSIPLKGEFDGEKIEVYVDLPNDVECISIIGDHSDHDGGSDVSSSEEEYYSDNEKEESTADNAPTVRLQVKIFKRDGKWLRFDVSASSDDIRVTRVFVAEPDPDSEYPHLFGPYALEDGSDLQSAFGEFIAMRGVEKKYFNFLYNYMIRNDDRIDVITVENMEKFFEE